MFYSLQLLDNQVPHYTYVEDNEHELILHTSLH
jgi:hypothetical protein